MAETIFLVGVSITLFIVFYGLLVYLVVASIIVVRRNKSLMRLQEKQILEHSDEIEEKKAVLKELSRKVRDGFSKVHAIEGAEKLRAELLAQQEKNVEMEMEIKGLKRSFRLLEKKESAEKSKPRSEKVFKADIIKQKYPVLPKSQLERVEVERQIARTLMRSNGGSFHVSQILRAVEVIYPKHIDPDTRITLFNEIKSWIERDPLCKAVKTAGSVQHYTFI